MPSPTVHVQTAKRANTLYEGQRARSTVTQSFHPTENSYDEGPALTSSDIDTIVLALAANPLIVSEMAGQGASPTAAAFSSASLPKEYLSDVLPKKVGS